MSTSTVADVAAWLTNAMLLVGPLTLLLGVFLHHNRGIAAPYGRFASKAAPGWGPLLPGRLAWVTQELPALLTPLLLAYHYSGHSAGSMSLRPKLSTGLSPCDALTAAFLIHYTYRSLIYPLRLCGPKGTALLVWAMATTFCCWNGFIQGYFLARQCPDLNGGGWQARHALGLAVWLTGWLLNLHSDGVLRNLRTSPADTGYKIPQGGLFKYVSAANYTAECFEWTGWALAAWHPAPAAFALFTFCNLAPRALSNHAWYLEKFRGQYPAQRRALIPLLW